MGGQQSTENASKPFTSSASKVLIPVDASKQAEAAFLWYLRHVHKPGNTVNIVHCHELLLSSPILSEHAFRTESYDEMLRRTKEDGEKIITSYQQKLVENDIDGTVTLEIGKPGELVVGCAEKFKSDHIVMGSRGYGVVRRTILGSVSEYVVHHTKIPVTVVPKETQSWFF